MTTVVRLGNPPEGSACVQGDLAVVHERPPLEVYALQPPPRDMPMSTALRSIRPGARAPAACAQPACVELCRRLEKEANLAGLNVPRHLPSGSPPDSDQP